MSTADAYILLLDWSFFEEHAELCNKQGCGSGMIYSGSGSGSEFIYFLFRILIRIRLGFLNS